MDNPFRTNIRGTEREAARAFLPLSIGASLKTCMTKIFSIVFLQISGKRPRGPRRAGKRLQR